jgi:hypothetical protein
MNTVMNFGFYKRRKFLDHMKHELLKVDEHGVNLVQLVCYLEVFLFQICVLVSAYYLQN